MESLGVTAHELDIRPAAQQMLADLGHPFARGEPVYDVTFENVQAGLRTDYLFRARQPPRRHRARHRRPVGAGAGLVHLRRRRPDVALQRQCRRAEDADPAPDPLGDLLRPVRRRGVGDAGGDPRHRDLARAGPGAEGGADPEHRGQGRPLRAAGLQPVLHAALRLPPVEDRLPGAARLGRRRARRVAARLPGGAARRLRPARDPPLAGGLPRSASSASASSSAPPCRTGRRSPPAARSRRAATGARPRTATRTPGWRSCDATCRRNKRRFTASRPRLRRSAPRRGSGRRKRDGRTTNSSTGH